MWCGTNLSPASSVLTRRASAPASPDETSLRYRRRIGLPRLDQAMSRRRKSRSRRRRTRSCARHDILGAKLAGGCRTRDHSRRRRRATAPQPRLPWARYADQCAGLCGLADGKPPPSRRAGSTRRRRTRPRNGGAGSGRTEQAARRPSPPSDRARRSSSPRLRSPDAGRGGDHGVVGEVDFGRAGCSGSLSRYHVVNRTRSCSAMSDSEPPGSAGQPGHDRFFARLRNFLRLIRRPRNGESLRETIDEMIEEPADDDAHSLSGHERLLIGNVLKIHDQTAADVMVPRVDIVALDAETPFHEVVKCMVEQGHSRVPVYRETLDDVIGFIHVKDVLGPVAERREPKLGPLLRKALFVAPSAPILDLLVQMRQARTHIAMVVDEFGGIDGLVTIEDLIEEIVGEIEDEHDVADGPSLTERADGTLIADARTPIEVLEEHQGTRLRPTGEQEEVDTLGGLVSSLAGRVPKRGEVIAHPSGIEFEVLDADPRRVKRLRVRSPPAMTGDRDAAGD